MAETDLPKEIKPQLAGGEGEMISPDTKALGGVRRPRNLIYVDSRT